MKITTRMITLIAMLSTIAIVGRYIFTPIPNVQPATFIIIISGFIFGPLVSVSVAVVTTLVSGMLTSIGIWTFFQALAWGLIGLFSGLMKDKYKKIPKFILSIYFVFTGYFFGIIMSISTLIMTDFMTTITYYIAGLPYDTYHTVGNIVFYIVGGKTLLTILEKYKNNINKY